MKKDTKVNLIVGGISAAVMTFGVRNYVSIIRKERLKREVIASGLDKDLRAIWFAAGKVDEKLQRGDYRGKSTDDLLTDMKFERLIAREKDNL